MNKNITLSAQEQLIEKARLKAQHEHKSLNSLFRSWLKNYAFGDSLGDDYELFMDKVEYVKIDQKFTREEMNER